MTEMPTVKSPLQSNAITILLFTIMATMLTELGKMLAVHKVDWWELGAALCPQVAGMIVRLAMPDIQAPPVLNSLFGGLLNRWNPPAPKP